jgi:hypothetical protein
MAPRSANPKMDLADLLSDKRHVIIDRWFDAVAHSYPSETARHLLESRDQFHNPVGHTLRRRLPTLFDAVMDRADPSDLAESVAEIVRIRTVQSDTPSQAVAFVYLLKNIVRDLVSPQLTDSRLSAQLREFESKIDGLALVVFDEFMACRERICEIRVREVQMKTAKLVEQVNKLYGGAGENADVVEDEKRNAGNS